MNKYLEKIAKKVDEDLGDHQIRALDKLDETGGLLLHHSLGSGKTKTFLTAIQRVHQKDPNARAIIIAPASLTVNVDKEIKKHKLTGINRKNLEVYSYEKASNISEELKKNKYAIAIADEAHKMRNKDSKRTRNLREIIEGADKRLLATATGNYNHIADISPLINMAAGSRVLPEERARMEAEFTTTKQKKRSILQALMGKKPEEYKALSGNKYLSKVMSDHVHYYDSEDDEEAKKNFPDLKEKNVEIEMSPEQLQYYKFAEGKLPWLLRMKVRHNMPLDKKDKANLNSFSTGVRQVSTGYRHLNSKGKVEYTPKIKAAVASLEKRMKDDKNFRGLVYSNYLEAGLDEYSSLLKKKGISHELYTGALSREAKDKLIERYNKGDLKTLLVSSAGGEGLNTIGTKLVQTLEPHFNKAKIDQVVGRAKRFKSHSHLPKEEQKVEVEHFLSTHPKSMFGKSPYSIDKYLNENSDTKNELFDDIKQIMKQHAK